jgi:hypothetical protein
MHKILTHWRTIIYCFCGLKLLAILLLPIGRQPGDFADWIAGASSLLQTILAGKLPTLSTYGVYIGIETILAPFFWLWTILPVEHPNLANLVQHTASTVSLGLLMRLPIFLCDAATLILLMRAVRRITNSEQKSIVAGLTWFVNPFNFFMLYFFGAMDIIPIAFFLLAINFELGGRWFRFGVSAIVSGLLRLFAFIAYPFFIPLTKTRPTRASFIFGSIVPIAFAICVIYFSGDSLATVSNIPATQSWLLEFFGWNVMGLQFVKLSPVLVLFQLYVVLRFWRDDTNIVYLASVSLLALLLAGTLYAGERQHFLWVSPLLSACVAMRSEDSWIYILTFFTALIAPTVNPFCPCTSEPIVFNTFLGGAFYAMKATYLLKLNLSNFQTPL